LFSVPRGFVTTTLNAELAELAELAEFAEKRVGFPLCDLSGLRV
jgi:hypothetical protein